MRILTRVVATLFLAGGVAWAATITFDDLPPTSSYNPIPDGYGGLEWDSNFYYMNRGYHPGTGYDKGCVSPDYVAFNAYANPTFFSDGDFTFNSAYFTSAWWDGNVLEVIGYNDGIWVASRYITLNRAGPVLAVFNWTVDEVTFSSSWDQFVMDDLTINATVPEAGATIALLGLALLGVFGLRRKVS